MVNESIKNGTRLCYKKNENGYAWVTVTEHKEGNLTYIREGKSVTVPDSVIDSRLFTTLQEARDKGLILDQDYENIAGTNIVGELKELEYFLGEAGLRSGHALDSSLIKRITDYVDEHRAKISIRRAASGRPPAEWQKVKEEAQRKVLDEEEIQNPKTPQGKAFREIRKRLEKDSGYRPTAQGRAADLGKKQPEHPFISEKFDFGPDRSADTPSLFEELEGDGKLPFGEPSYFKEVRTSDCIAGPYDDEEITSEEPAEQSRPKASEEISPVPTDEFNDWLKKLDKTFGETMLTLIEERHMKNSEFYNRANISKQLFYRITTQFDHPPKKSIALACAVALKLDLQETKDLLEKAGYALSHSDLTDVIVEAFITAKHYDIFDINEYLYRYDRSLLGSNML